MESKLGEFSRYLRIWWFMTQKTSQVAFESRLGAVLFTTGKILRFIFFLVFLLLLVSKTKTIAGYTIWQVVFFFVTFNLVDILAQFLLREVYRFRNYVLTGNFDYLLLKPQSVLFRILFGGSDALDLVTFLPLIGFIFYTLNKLGQLSFLGIALYLLLIFNAFLIALAFHIGVAAIGVMTTEVDNAIWIFRDMTLLGRVPVDVYREPVSWILTFIIPVGLMITFPVRGLLGLLSWEGVVYSFVFSFIFLLLSMKLWRYSLKQYTSASS